MTNSNPNILLIIWDAVRADFTTPYKADIDTTPTLAGIANEGIKYDGAFAPSNWTGTSHGALFTGQYPTQSGVIGLNGQMLPEDRPTIAERVQNQGYNTFFRSSGTHLRTNLGYDRGIDEYHISTPSDIKEIYRPNWHKKMLIDNKFRSFFSQNIMSGPDRGIQYHLHEFLDFVEDSTENPWFSFMNLNIAHNPYDPPLPYKGYFDPDLKQPRYNLMEAIGIAGQDHQRYSMERLETLSSDYPVLADEITPTSGEWATIQSWYAGAIRYLDDQLTWIRSQLQARDEWDNTLVIVTADHGEYFGEYNLEKHNFGLYDPVVQIPLVIRPPHSLDKKIPDQTPPLVSLIDLYPTISRIIGASKLSDTSGVDLFSKKAFDSERVVCSEVSEKPIDAIESRHGEFNGHPENQGVQAIRTLDGVVEFPQKSETRARSWVDFPANMAKEMSPDSLVEEAHKVQKSQLGSLPKRAGKHPTYNEEHRKKLEALGYI